MPAPHKTLRARPVDRLTEERQVMRELPEQEPDVDRRWVTDALGPDVPCDPELRRPGEESRLYGD
jgi:hypothetical protein